MFSSRSFVCIVLVALICGAAGLASADVVTVAYYRLGDDDLGATAGNTGNATTVDLSGNGHSLTRSGAPAYSSDTTTDDPPRTDLSMSFNPAHSPNDAYSSTNFLTSLDNFGIQAYVKTSTYLDRQALVTIGRGDQNGMGLVVQGSGAWGGMIGGLAWVTTEAFVNTWAQLALVRASGTTTLYVNGVAKATTTTAPNAASNYFSIGYDVGAGNYATDGLIDEVRVFTFTPGHFEVSDLTYPVPEPGTLALVATGLIGLLAYAWRNWQMWLSSVRL